MDILLFGSEKDNRIIKEIYPTLKERYDAYYCGDRSVLGSVSPKITICDRNCKIKSNTKVDLIILKERADVYKLKLMDKKTPILFWQSKKRQRYAISKLGFNAIPCGLSQKDTLTFSSVLDGSSTISLQRELFGHTPKEILAVYKNKISQYSLLLIGAIVLYLEDQDEIKLQIKN